MWVHAQLGDWYVWMLVRIYAALNDKSVSDVVREAVHEYLSRRLGDVDMCRNCMLEDNKLLCLKRCVADAMAHGEW